MGSGRPSEDEAWAFLEKAISESAPADDFRALSFDGWPAYDLYLSVGEASLTTSMMEVFIAFQDSIWRSYAILKYGEPDLRRLTDEERKELQFQVIVSPGSTITKADINKIATAYLKEALAKMSGPQIAITAIATVLLWCSSSVMNSYLQSRLDIRRAELLTAEKQDLLATQRFQSEQETVRAKILERAYERVELLREVDDLMTGPRELFLKNVPADAEVVFQGVHLDGAVANELARNPRNESRPLVQSILRSM